MFLNNATNNNCLYCYLGDNVGSGVQIVGGSGNNFNDGEAYYNGQYGYWIDASSENTFTDNLSYGNTIAGFYLGCDLTGEICTKWNERKSTWRKSGSCQSRGTSQSKS